MNDFEQSNGNIFADLGDPEADQTLVRAQLLSRIIEIISQRNLTEDQKATTLQLSKPETSALINGKLSQFSLEKLFQINVVLLLQIITTDTLHGVVACPWRGKKRAEWDGGNRRRGGAW